MALKRRWAIGLMSAVLAAGTLLVAGCGDGGGSGGGGEDLSGTIVLDGSSTVAPISEAAAEQFQGEHSGVRVTVGTSGTGGGFEKFCRGETDISNASRPIAEDEIAACEGNEIEFEQIAVANDALSVALNPENDWARCLTVEQLNAIWDRGSTVDNWNQVDPSFPDERLQLYGPGTDSGTFDYFTDAINGDEGVQRTNYNNVGEDDNATITGVSGSRGAMGYLGFSFVEQNPDAVIAAEIDGGEGCVAPSAEAVIDGSYQPLGRALYVYPSGQALQRPEVQEFLRFYIEQNDAIAEQALLIPLSDEQRAEALEKVESLAAGGAETSE